MSVFSELESKLVDLKNKVNGELRSLVLNLESVFQHVHKSPVENVVKEAVASNIHDAATSVERLADTLRSDTDAVDQAVVVADTAVKKTATK